jgi:hypothetical protein
MMIPDPARKIIGGIISVPGVLLTLGCGYMIIEIWRKPYG